MACTWPLKPGVIRNSLLNPYKAKQTQDRLNFKKLYGFLNTHTFKHSDALKYFYISNGLYLALKPRVIRNSLLNLYKAKQTQERLHCKKLYGFKYTYF